MYVNVNSRWRILFWWQLMGISPDVIASFHGVLFLQSSSEKLPRTAEVYQTKGRGSIVTLEKMQKRSVYHYFSWNLLTSIIFEVARIRLFFFFGGTFCETVLILKSRFNMIQPFADIFGMTLMTLYVSKPRSVDVLWGRSTFADVFFIKFGNFSRV